MPGHLEIMISKIKTNKNDEVLLVVYYRQQWKDSEPLLALMDQLDNILQTGDSCWRSLPGGQIIQRPNDGEWPTESRSFSYT